MSTRSDGWAGCPARGWTVIGPSGGSGSNLPREVPGAPRGYSSACMGPGIVPLDNPVQNYAWGSRTTIAELLGRPSPEGKPEAELWIGAHPQAPSRVARSQGPRTLDALVRSAPESLLGREVARRWAGELPLLMKMIAPSEPHA